MRMRSWAVGLGLAVALALSESASLVSSAGRLRAKRQLPRRGVVSETAYAYGSTVDDSDGSESEEEEYEYSSSVVYPNLGSSAGGSAGSRWSSTGGAGASVAGGRAGQGAGGYRAGGGGRAGGGRASAQYNTYSTYSNEESEDGGGPGGGVRRSTKIIRKKNRKRGGRRGLAGAQGAVGGGGGLGGVQYETTYETIVDPNWDYDYETFEREVPIYVVKKVKSKRNKVVKSKKKIKRKRKIKKKIVVKQVPQPRVPGPRVPPVGPGPVGPGAGGRAEWDKRDEAAFSGYVLVPRSFGIPAVQWQYSTEVVPGGWQTVGTHTSQLSAHGLLPPHMAARLDAAQATQVLQGPASQAAGAAQMAGAAQFAGAQAVQAAQAQAAQAAQAAQYGQAQMRQGQASVGPWRNAAAASWRQGQAGMAGRLPPPMLPPPRPVLPPYPPPPPPLPPTAVQPMLRAFPSLGSMGSITQSGAWEWNEDLDMTDPLIARLVAFMNAPGAPQSASGIISLPPTSPLAASALTTLTSGGAIGGSSMSSTSLSAGAMDAASMAALTGRGGMAVGAPRFRGTIYETREESSSTAAQNPYANAANPYGAQAAGNSYYGAQAGGNQYYGAQGGANQYGAQSGSTQYGAQAGVNPYGSQAGANPYGGQSSYRSNSYSFSLPSSGLPSFTKSTNKLKKQAKTN